MKKRYIIPILVVLCILSIFIGVNRIGIVDIINKDIDKINILLLGRIPRMLTIVISGMALSIAGVIMQQISNNKFVSPTTAATIDSAKLGILVSLLIFSSASMMEKMITAFIFSIIGTLLFMSILKRVRVKNTIFIPLVGIMLGNVIGALTDFIAYEKNLVQNMNSFLQGDFSMILQGNYELIFLTVPLIIIAFIYAKKFTIIGMGEDISKNLGLNYKKIVNIGLVIVAMISALVVIIVGNIPFVGLVVPNIVSIFNGDDIKKNLGITALLGGMFVLMCDIVGRLVIFPYEVPISLTVGVIGSIIFLILLFRRSRNA